MGDGVAKPTGYRPVSRPRQGGKTSELKAMEEDVQVATIAQYLQQAEKNTTSLTHNLGFHRVIAQRLYIDGIRFVPQEDQGTDTVASEDIPGEPGLLWEDEGISHRAALTAHGDDAVFWVARIKNMAGNTVYLTPAKRRALAAALLDGLPEEDTHG